MREGLTLIPLPSLPCLWCPLVILARDEQRFLAALRANDSKTLSFLLTSASSQLAIAEFGEDLEVTTSFLFMFPSFLFIPPPLSLHFSLLSIHFPLLSLHFPSFRFIFSPKSVFRLRSSEFVRRKILANVWGSGMRTENCPGVLFLKKFLLQKFLKNFSCF
jgi:hypothetical protein